jgi:hypothetical protein
MAASRRLGSALIALACAACEGPPSRARIDDAPILSARPLDGTRVVVQFDRLASSAVVDLATGTREPASGSESPAGVEPGPTGLAPSSDPEGQLLVGFTPIDGPASLLRYVAATGTMFVLARDVAPRIGGTGLHRFAFQHPATGSGDLLLVRPEGVLALGARADLTTDFVASGTRVAFRGEGGGEPRLMVANLDGTGARAVGPAADRVIFSPDGAHLLFEAQGLLWAEDPQGPAVPLDELGRMGLVIVSGSGDRLLYSVLSGEGRGTFFLQLRTVPGTRRPAWVAGS